ncbi:uncharacterized protein LOC134198510 isoform X2 [Corticium candelabrum]|uniref:uncharacterized protein LOC134198510 isoform X2 n=1 Tax=Corticium candelabrum TaxID=121492 RepID=UPI002E26E7AA|nr:uncharacterized protein LOC134198510 isoform X2 [Corticium candelabrum]
MLFTERVTGKCALAGSISLKMIPGVKSHSGVLQGRSIAMIRAAVRAIFRFVARVAIRYATRMLSVLQRGNADVEKSWDTPEPAPPANLKQQQNIQVTNC